MFDQSTVESMDMQLRSLYQDRERLQDRFGVSGVDDVITMVESLESQLRDFYDRYGGINDAGDGNARLLGQLGQISQSLDPMFTARKVVFALEHGEPVLRAEWTNVTNG